MSQEEQDKARDIFTRPANQWTNDELGFLDTLFKKGYRAALKTIRAEVQNA